MELDLDYQWMPFTANKTFKAQPKLLKSAEGMYYTSIDDRKILDGTAGLWCVNAGHQRTAIINAIQQQAAIVDYVPGFQLGHPLAFEYAKQLAAILPEDIQRIFFCNSGSEAVDTTLKIALAYHQAKGNPERNILIGRNRGYHGVGFGGISVGGITNNRRFFSLLPNVAHLPDTHNLAHNAFSRGIPQWGAHLADALIELIEQHGPHRIAAVIVEPVAGSTGVLLPPLGYLQRLRQICDEHQILLIFDEIITGFGRLGAAFAAQCFAVTPDIMAIAKGLTNGSVPMGAACVKQEIYDTVINSGADGAIEFYHGYTYSGHPLACAAASACLQLYQTEQLFNRALQLEHYWEDCVHNLCDLPHVIDIRNLGLVAAIELQPRDNAPGKRAYEIFTQCFERGLLIRITGDIIALSPPLIIEKQHIDELFSILATVIKNIS